MIQCFFMHNIELAEKMLHWKPSVTLEIGLNKTINYFRERGV